MKIRTGFVSNSSSSSFIIAYKTTGLLSVNYYNRNYYRSNKKEFLEEWVEKVKDRLYEEGMTLVYTQGYSGECENMYIPITKEIADYIHKHDLLNKPFFYYGLEDIIQIKFIMSDDEAEEYIKESDDYLWYLSWEKASSIVYSKLFKKIAEKVKDFDDDTYINFHADVDYSSPSLFGFGGEKDPLDVFLMKLNDGKDSGYYGGDYED